MLAKQLKINTAILGGSGYVGHELLKLLLAHPAVDLVCISSREHQGKSVASVHRDLEGLTGIPFSPVPDSFTDIDLAFVVAPKTESMEVVKQILSSSPLTRVIDLGTDFRLNPQTFKSVYGISHTCPELHSEAVYGLPELNSKEIASARLVANPGCFAACITLALLPLAEEKLLLRPVRVSALTGSTGSGKVATAKTHHPERNESLAAYDIFSHRHVPEVESILSRASSDENQVTLSFVPISGPFSRGIYATCFVELPSSHLDVTSLYQIYAKEHPFLRLRDTAPLVREVRGSNFCDLSVFQLGNEVIVLGAIDNLIKGAAGNAVQCMNLMFDLDQTDGLRIAPLAF